MNDICFNQEFIRSVGRPMPVKGGSPAAPAKTGGDFESLLKERIRLSGHAAKRAENRDIDLSAERMNEISDAVRRAEEKGLRDVLILQNRQAFIVNVPTKTVITVLNREDMQSHVFTNIDGAVIV